MNAYLRAAQSNPLLREQAIAALDKRRQESESVEPEHAREGLECSLADDSSAAGSGDPAT